jgi:hypothetical protein
MSRLIKIYNNGESNQMSFKAFDVGIGISAADEAILEAFVPVLDDVFPNGFEEIGAEEIEYNFTIEKRHGNRFNLSRNGELILEDLQEAGFLGFMESYLRATIAEFAVSKVFLHAGVVGWKDKAIVIPANSFAGKTSLVAELVKLGALYYSDEFAVLDAEGNVQPYPKMLSLRGIIDDYRQVNRSVESLGGIAGTKPIPVGMVLITQYKAKKSSESKKQPKILSSGQGIMEILPHTIPLRNKPEFALGVLNKVASRAIIVRIERGEAREFAGWLLNYFESQVD